MSTLFLRNPRLTVLTIGMICVAGLSSYIILPRMEDPLLTERAAFVLTSFPGADAELVEAQITDPIEDELREIAEIKELRSISRSSFSTITIELNDDVYAEQAPAVWSRIRDRIADAEAALPATASRPRFEKIEVTAYTRLIGLVWDPPVANQPSPSHILSSDVSNTEEPKPTEIVSDNTAGHGILRRLAEELREQLLTVPGTKDVDIYGQAEEEILIEIKPEALAAMGLSAGSVSRAIEASDSRFSAGQLRANGSNLLLELSG